MRLLSQCELSQIKLTNRDTSKFTPTTGILPTLGVMRVSGSKSPNFDLFCAYQVNLAPVLL